jgi:hypothetical protein
MEEGTCWLFTISSSSDKGDFCFGVCCIIFDDCGRGGRLEGANEDREGCILSNSKGGEHCVKAIGGDCGGGGAGGCKGVKY